MAEQVAEPSNGSQSARLAFVVLILMQLLSLASVFVSICLLNDDIPIPSNNPGIVWSFFSSFGILFPLLTTHFHVTNRRQPITGWFTWWLGVIALFSILLLCLSGFMDEELHESEKNRILTFYIAAIIGGSLGAILMQGIVGRFLPRVLGGITRGHPAPKRKFGIKTILFWITSLAIVGTIYTNAERIGIEVFPRIDNSLPVALLIGFIWGIVLALFVWLPLTKWFQHFRPYWLSISSLSLTVGLLTLATIGTITVFAFDFSAETYWLANCFAMQLAFIVIIVGTWIFFGRKAGLLITPDLQSVEQRKSRGFFRKGMSGINWLTQRFAWLCAAASIIYTSLWSWTHFVSGGDERNIENISKGTLAESDNWLEEANRRWGQDIHPDQNVIVGIIRLLNPIGSERGVESYYKQLGIESPESKKVEPEPFPGMFSPEESTEYRYLETLRKKIYDSEGYERKIEGISEEERYFMSRLLRDSDGYEIDKRKFEDAPWTREMCTVAADQLDEQRPILEKLRQLSKQDQFYSPWVLFDHGFIVGDFGTEVIRDAQSLLQMSAMYHLGNDDVERALADCLAIDRLAKPEWNSQLPNAMLREWRFNLRRPAVAAALHIVFHPKVTSEQLKELQKVAEEREAKEATGLDAEFRNAAARRLAFENVFRTLIPVENEKKQFSRARVLGWCRENPSVVDWVSARETFDQLVSRERELLNSAYSGKLSKEELRQRLGELKDIEGTRVRKSAVYDSVYGYQLLAFVRGPEYKGKIFGTIATDWVFGSLTNGIYIGQQQRNYLKIAIGLRQWKLQNGSWPDSLQQLVPEMLDEVPTDSVSQKPYVYVNKGSTYLLYSVGENGTDEGGDLVFDDVFEHPWPNLIEHVFNNRDY